MHLDSDYRVLRPLSVALWLALAGCGDGTPAVPNAPSLDTAPVTIFDPMIDAGDSYVVADITSSQQMEFISATPLIDPNTGETTSSLTIHVPEIVVHAEVGYDISNGALRSNLYLPSSRLDSIYSEGRTPVARVTSVGGVVHLHDGTGTEIPLAGVDQSFNLDVYTGPLDSAVLSSGFVLPPDTEPPADTAGLVRGGTASSMQVARDGQPMATRAQTARAAAGRDNDPGSWKRRYRREGNRYVLAHMESTRERMLDGGRLRQTRVLSFRNVRSKTVPARDSVRRARLLSSPIASRGLASVGPQLAVTVPPRTECDDPADCPDDGGGSGGGPGGGSGGGSTTPPPGECAAISNASSTNTPIVLQHGMKSDACTWSQMEPWLVGEFSLGLRARFSLPWRENLESQAQMLLNNLTTYAPTKSGFIAIGHSAGGVIVRRAAQLNPTKIRGVITIDSPNQGALLALNARTTVSSVVSGFIQRLQWGCPFDQWDPGCMLGKKLASDAVARASVDWGADAAIPMSADVRPAVGTRPPSFFIATLNGFNETFPRAGIQSFTPHRWSLVRLMGDSHAGPTGAGGGRELVAWADYAYYFFTTCEVVAVVAGKFDNADTCAMLYGGMDATDFTWNRLTSGYMFQPYAPLIPFDRTDGFVNGSSQYYPATGNGTQRNFTVRPGDSHTGVLRSRLTRDQLFLALRTQFGVTP